MKKNLLLFCFLIVQFFSYAQNNLVGNPSFENILPGCNQCNHGGGTYSESNTYWSYQYPWTVPERKTACFQFGVGTSDWRSDGGHTGSHYGYCDYLEYIVARLQNTVSMIPNHVYYIEYWAKGQTALTDGGLRLFENKPEQCGGGQLTDDGVPQVPIPYGTDLTNWTKVSSFYTADKAYEWLGLGNFNTEGHANGANYNFDDISIIEVGSSTCPDVNYIQNTTFQNIGKITFASQNLTIAGNNIASTILQGNVVIDDHAIVEFKSATKVVMEPGFIVNEGAYFEAKIAPCDADCFPPVANGGADANSCSGQSIQLGGSDEFGNTYSWSADPSSALAYLSNASSSNPVFTPPPSGYGIIVYTFTVTNMCNQSATDEIQINYENSPNNSPAVNVSNINYTDLINFDVSYGTQTEQLIIEVWTANGVSLLNSYTYNLGTDFNCCTYHWQIPATLSPCQDYQIKVYAKNLCSTVLSAPFIINWVRNRNLSFTQVSNVITPDGNGENDSWCFTFTGGVQYHVVITNPSGVPVYDNSGSISPPQACVWNGECNQPACSNPLSENTYFYVLTITGCDGSTINTEGFISLFRDASRMSHATNTPDTASASKKMVNQIKTTIYPNPTNGMFQITVTKNNQAIGVKDVKIYDMIGKVIWENNTPFGNLFNVDISGYAPGIYYVRAINEAGDIDLKKLIKQ